MSGRLPDYELLSKGGFGCSSLWLGQDHLLYIEGTGFLFPVHERYRRFRYADIKSIAVAKNSVRGVGAVLLGLLVLVSSGCVVSILSSGDDRLAIADVALGLLVAMQIVGMVLLVRHCLRGTGCVSELETRTGPVQPRPLRRLRSARRSLRRLEERMQGEGAASEIQELANGDEVAPAWPRWTQLACRATGALSLASSLLLLAMVLSGLTGKVIAILFSGLALLAVSALLTSLAAVSRRPVRMELRLLLWSLLVAFVLILSAGLVQFGVMAVSRPDLATEVLAFAQMFGRVQDFSPDAVAAFFVSMGGGSAVISAMILVLALGGADSAAVPKENVSTVGDS